MAPVTWAGNSDPRRVPLVEPRKSLCCARCARNPFTEWRDSGYALPGAFASGERKGERDADVEKETGAERN